MQEYAAQKAWILERKDGEQRSPCGEPGREDAPAMHAIAPAHRPDLRGQDGRFTRAGRAAPIVPIPAAPRIGVGILPRQEHEHADLVGERGDPRAGRNVFGRLPAAMHEYEHRPAAPSATAPWYVHEIF